ncbi:MAG: aminotransferase class III-fold pyridoxal phosphate-dependent enzyme [Nitrososphaerota archaeon]|nr:aminotransferase class III-fold pyridoxal phosphate-dependent enzyme [Nitrososphaerales archaeon]MDW8044461.1 aminotransferase class III-fold pyridoxal phosphate-dependent enzyme [Nitrososphaerota archaeon]
MAIDVNELENLWKKQHPKSKVLFEEAVKMIPGGIHHAMMIEKWPIERGVYPFYVTRAEGVKIWDVDGNVYTDYYAHAATFLGHTHPEVIKAIQEYAALGPFSHDFTEINLKLVKKITKMVPCAEMVDFVNSGTEANMGVLRYARAYTKRKKIITFAGHFHGWGDQLTSNRYGIPDEVFANTIVIPEGDVNLLERTVREHNPAAILFHFAYGSGGGGMAMGGEDPIEFMKAMREVANKYGVLLIADEVITGFRYAPGGAQQYFNIEVDLTTLGKIVGGAIGGSGAIVGKREIMEYGNPKARPAGSYVLTGGTFSGNPLNSAAGYAALDVIDRAEGRLNEHANRLGERFRKGLNEIFERYNFPAQAVGCCSTNGVAFTDKLPIKSAQDYKAKANAEKLYKWHMYLATHHGIYTYPGSGGIFITAVHTQEDIDHLIASTEEFVRKELA